MREKYDRYVHEFTHKNGTVRFAVAEWVQSANQYQRPTSVRTYNLTGCSREYSGSVAYFGGWLTRRQALREARYLYGKQDEE